MKLYELTGRYAAIYEAAIDADGEVPDALFADLEAAKSAVEEKVASCVAVLRNLESDRDALKAESDRFAKRAKVAANAAERLKDYVLRSLQAARIDSLNAGPFRVRRQASPVALVVADEDAVPAGFKRLVAQVDRGALKAALERGETVPGAALARGEHLRIS